MLNFILGTYPLISALASCLLAQFLKPFTHYLKHKEFIWRKIFASGGEPSSHTASVSALLLSVGLLEGFQSSSFAITAVLAFIIAYDAMNVRYYAGANIKLTKQLIEDLKDEQTISLNLQEKIYSKKMKEILGHEKLEVLFGLIWGILVAFCLYYLYY